MGGFAQTQCDRSTLHRYSEYILIAGGIASLAVVMSGHMEIKGPLAFLDSHKTAGAIFLSLVAAAGLYKFLCMFMYPEQLLKKTEACQADCQCESGECKGNVCE